MLFHPRFTIEKHLLNPVLATMHSAAFLLTAVALVDAAVAAKYDVYLCPDSGCKGEAFTFPDIKKRTCCSNKGTKYYAAILRDSVIKTCADEFRGYNVKDPHYCYLSWATDLLGFSEAMLTS